MNRVIPEMFRHLEEQWVREHLNWSPVAILGGVPQLREIRRIYGHSSLTLIFVGLLEEQLQETDKTEVN